MFKIQIFGITIWQTSDREMAKAMLRNFIYIERMTNTQFIIEWPKGSDKFYGLKDLLDYKIIKAVD